MMNRAEEASETVEELEAAELGAFLIREIERAAPDVEARRQAAVRLIERFCSVANRIGGQWERAPSAPAFLLAFGHGLPRFRLRPAAGGEGVELARDRDGSVTFELLGGIHYDAATQQFVGVKDDGAREPEGTSGILALGRAVVEAVFPMQPGTRLG